ncbi:MAG TPA: hypothetical protein VEA35_15205 [Ramlibacter sp.]|nr:hypothetical protein [Ramlibacter sp.]
MPPDAAPEVLAGALHVLHQPLAVALLAAVLLALRELPPRLAAASLAVLLAGAALTLLMRPAAWHQAFVAACIALLGAVTAGALRLPRWMSIGSCAPAGVALGLGSGVPLSSGGEVAGILLAAAVLLVALQAAWRLASVRWLGHSMREWAPRVAGAWLAAIGSLVGALALLRA